MTETPRLSRKQLRELGQLTTRSDDTPSLTDTAELRLRRPSRKEMREAERAEREQNLELERIAQQEAAEKAAKEAEINAATVAETDFVNEAELDSSNEAAENVAVSDLAEAGVAEELVADNAIDFFDLGNKESDEEAEVEPAVAVPARKSIFDRFSEDENSSEEPESESVEVEEPTGFEDFLTEAEEEIQANESTLAQTVEVTTQAEPELEVEQTPSLRERLFSRMRRNHSFEQVLASTPETKTLADDEKAVANAAVSEDKAEEVEAAQDAVEVLNSEDVLEEVREIDLEETEIPVDSEVENLSEDSVAVEETEVEENVEETEVEETTELNDAIDTSDATEIEETVVDEEVVSELDSELTESEENLQESVEETLEEKISGDDTLSVPEVSDAQVQPLGVVEEVETAEEEVAVAAESVSIRSWIIFALLVLIVAVLGYLGGSWIHNTFFAAPAGEQLIENLQSFLL